MILYLLHDDLPWWDDLVGLAAGDGSAQGPAASRLIRQLVQRGLEDPWVAAADALLYGPSAAWGAAEDAPGVVRALAWDVATIGAVTKAASERERAPAEQDGGAPRPVQLAPPAEGEVARLAARIREGAPAEELVASVRRFRLEHGGGPLGRYRAFRWRGRLRGVEAPTDADASRLVGVDRPLAALEANTISFLQGRPAMHALLYGPRGSGKSTAVRGLLRRHAERGLRLVELPPAALAELPDVLAPLAGRPERFVLFVDDLSFEAGDARYAPLKTLLEGSVARRPDNVRLYATSNRRHLVQERLRDRPDPLDDDVHAWDTQHERLALADRFGLLLTFPSADRRRYLEIVRRLASHDGLQDDDLEARADRFARSGNGYSGRTAQQFVDAARSGLA